MEMSQGSGQYTVHSTQYSVGSVENPVKVVLRHIWGRLIQSMSLKYL
jgi:hypothetical protein